MTRYFNIDRYRRRKYGLISIYILLFDTNTIPHSYKPGFPKISTVPPGRSNSAILSLTIWPVHRSYGVHHCGQGGKAHGSGKGNPVTPVPRPLANPELDQRVLFLPDAGPADPLSGTRLGHESSQVRIGPKTGLSTLWVTGTT